MSKKAPLPNPVVTPPPVPPNPTAPQPPPPPTMEGIQVSDGGEQGERPGPKPAKVGDTSTGIGAVSAADLNDRRWEAKKTALRKLVQEQSDEVNRAAPKNQPLFGKLADEPIEGETTAEEPTEAKTEPTSEEPKTSDELAQLAAKDRENRRLRRELKKVVEAPKGVALEKLKELSKTNPRGVAEFLGISLEALNLAFLSGKPADPVKLEDEKPKAADPERVRLKEERDAAVAEAARARMQEARRTGHAYASKLVAESTDAEGRARWPLMQSMGDESVALAMGRAFAFAGGKIDENGNPLAKPRKMKPLTQKDAEGVVEHFVDMEERRLAALRARLSPGSSKPEPRNPVRPMANGYTRPQWDPTNPHDPNNPRNRPDYRAIGDKVRAKFFGPR